MELKENEKRLLNIRKSTIDLEDGSLLKNRICYMDLKNKTAMFVVTKRKADVLESYIYRKYNFGMITDTEALGYLKNIVIVNAGPNINKTILKRIKEDYLNGNAHSFTI